MFLVAVKMTLTWCVYDTRRSVLPLSEAQDHKALSYLQTGQQLVLHFSSTHFPVPWRYDQPLLWCVNAQTHISKYSTAHTHTHIQAYAITCSEMLKIIYHILTVSYQWWTFYIAYFLRWQNIFGTNRKWNTICALDNHLWCVHSETHVSFNCCNSGIILGQYGSPTHPLHYFCLRFRLSS